MPRGAPDWTQLTDDAYSHYRLKYNKRLIFEITTDTITFLEKEFVGVFGIWVVCVDDPQIRLEVFADDVRVAGFDMNEVYNWMGTGRDGGLIVAGISKYDVVNDIYTIWIDFSWHLYIHSKLKLTLKSLAGSSVYFRDSYYFYKERL